MPDTGVSRFVAWYHDNRGWYESLVLGSSAGPSIERAFTPRVESGSMADVSLLVAVALGVLQGVLEWLPISSEGNVALVLAGLGASPTTAVQLALSLHLGTAVAATAYYRGEIASLLNEATQWRPADGLFGRAELGFLAVATVISGAVGIGAYVALVDLVSALAGGAFIAAIGILLVVTGLAQRLAGSVEVGTRGTPGAIDGLLVGVGQGIAILPGVSRSGTTISVLLLRGYDGERSFRLSFLLSIPAAVGAALLAWHDAGVGGLGVAWLVALLVSAIVGYATIGALMGLVRRVAFWAVCVGLGTLAVIGGLLIWLA